MAPMGQQGPLSMWLAHGASKLVVGGWLSWGCELGESFPVLLELSTELLGLGLPLVD